MMNKLNLSKLKSCPEPWEKMSPKGHGRLCHTCNKTIIDMRAKSSREINLLHLLSSEPVCGLYSKKQLNQNNYKRSTNSSRIPVLGFSLLSLITSGETLASGEPTTQAFHVTENSGYKSFVSDVALPDSVYFSGRVFETNVNGDLEPIPFATVYIPELDIGTNTDFDGFFELNVSQVETDLETVSVVIQYVGYSRIVYEGLNPRNPRAFEVEMNANTATAFGVAIQPYHKRAWWKFKGLFRRNKQ